MTCKWFAHQNIFAVRMHNTIINSGCCIAVINRSFIRMTCEGFVHGFCFVLESQLLEHLASVLDTHSRLFWLGCGITDSHTSISSSSTCFVSTNSATFAELTQRVSSTGEQLHRKTNWITWECWNAQNRSDNAVWPGFNDKQKTIERDEDRTASNWIELWGNANVRLQVTSSAMSSSNGNLNKECHCDLDYQVTNLDGHPLDRCVSDRFLNLVGVTFSVWPLPNQIEVCLSWDK